MLRCGGAFFWLFEGLVLVGVMVGPQRKVWGVKKRLISDLKARVVVIIAGNRGNTRN